MVLKENDEDQLDREKKERGSPTDSEWRKAVVECEDRSRKEVSHLRGHDNFFRIIL